MPNPTAGETGGSLNITQLQNTAMNVVETLCSILSRPVELILRPLHGTRYFEPPVIFFSSMLMIFLPLVAAGFRGAASMIPFSHPAPPMGLFDLGSLTELYFLLSFAHGIRLYRRMFDMSLETNSYFEGPALFFFSLLPKGSSFWVTRICWEPLFVLVIALLMGHLFLFQSSLVTYLEVAALALAMKNFIEWYRAWEYLRTVLDMRYTGPIIAKLSEDRATEDDLATIHLASFPKNLPHDIRQAAVAHIERSFTSGNPNYSTQGESHATDK